MLNRVHGFELTTLVVIGNDCTGSCKSNNNTITATTAPRGESQIDTRKIQIHDRSLFGLRIGISIKKWRG